MGKAKTFSAQELRRVQDYIATRAHAQRNRAALLLTHLAGMRVGEVAALTWGGRVDLNNEISFALVQSLFCLHPQIHGSEPSPKKS